MHLVERAGGMVQWLQLPAWKAGNRGFEPHSGIQVSEKQNISTPLTPGLEFWTVSFHSFISPSSGGAPEPV